MSTAAAEVKPASTESEMKRTMTPRLSMPMRQWSSPTMSESSITAGMYSGSCGW